MSLEDRQHAYGSHAVQPLNLTTHRVLHHQMGNDSDFHSELSGLAHNSARDQNWQAGNNMLEALCEQLTRKDEGGDLLFKSLQSFNKPRSDDSKHSNVIRSPVYTI